jgi:hypothetical protein
LHGLDLREDCGLRWRQRGRVRLCHPEGEWGKALHCESTCHMGYFIVFSLLLSFLLSLSWLELSHSCFNNAFSCRFLLISMKMSMVLFMFTTSSKTFTKIIDVMWKVEAPISCRELLVFPAMISRVIATLFTRMVL